MQRRLFVAIAVDTNSQQTLLTTVKKLKTTAGKKDFPIKWSPFENYHSTLFFLGKTESEKIPELKQVIEKVAKEHASLQIELRGLGGFPSARGARVLWVGVQNSRSLRHLQDSLAMEFSRLELGKPDDEFVPHLTIARLRNARNCTDLISPFVRKSLGRFRCEKIVLYESIMQGNFPKYVPIEEFPLAPS